MPSIFPGMNPYLKHPELFPGLHHLLISEIARFLSPQLRPKYRVAVEVRMYETTDENSLLVGKCDHTLPDPQNSGIIRHGRTFKTDVNLPMSNDEYDSPWKEAIETYFQECIEFFFPVAAEGIDWKRGYTFLDKELQQVVRDAELGQRFVDKLVQVWQRNGEERWVLVHLEVQSYEETNFAQRMYVYHYRLFDRYNRSIASLAILGDDRPTWKPNQFSDELWGCEVKFKFPIVKLLEYSQQWGELEASSNPFATVVMAHLKAKETRQDNQGRKRWKLDLTKRLYEKGYQREDIINLFRFIDWVMKLPEELENSFWQEVTQYEDEKKMPYITSVERRGIAQGIELGIEQGIEQGIELGKREGLLEGIEMVLELKFGSEGLTILPEVAQIQNVEILRAILTSIKTVNNLEQLQQIYQ